MTENANWKTKTAVGTGVTAAAIGGGMGIASLIIRCDSELARDTSNARDLINLREPNAATINRVGIEWPYKLVSTQDNLINLQDAEQVAKALNITLTGDKNQHLYDIQIGNIGSHGYVYGGKIIPITVANVAEGAAIINAYENAVIVSDDIKKFNPALDTNPASSIAEAVKRRRAETPDTPAKGK